jgi:lycopene cyclase domain-containing protein
VTFAYLGLLLFSLIGLSLIDFKFKLAFFSKPKRSAVAIAIPFALFVFWDLAGSASGIFFRGQNTLLTGIQVFPEFPIEELFFLALLCYSTLIVFTWVQKTLTSRESGGR